MSTLGIPTVPHHTLRTPHPVKQVAWRPASLSAFTGPSTQQHLTELLVVPRTIGVSPFGVRGNISKESELPVREAGGDDMADCDKDRPGVWDVRRHHVPKYVLLGGEGAVAGKSSQFSFHFLLWRATELPKFKPVDAVWASSDTICTVYQSGAFVRHDIAYSYAPLLHPNASVNVNSTGSSTSGQRNEVVPQVMDSGSMNRHALAWDTMGGVAFASGPMSPGEIPFDDM